MANTPRDNPKDTPKAPDAKPATGTGDVHTGETRHFEGSIVKIDKDGNEVLSSYLEPGERLRREETDRYSAVRATPPDADKKNTDQ